MTGALHRKEFAAGHGANTAAYVQWCQSLYPDKHLVFVWDGATYHRGAAMQALLTRENAGLAEADWKVTCLMFAPNAPDQNPVEDVWLKGKNHLRKNFAVNKTFAKVKHWFCDCLSGLSFASVKLSWYWPDPQMT